MRVIYNHHGNQKCPSRKEIENIIDSYLEIWFPDCDKSDEWLTIVSKCASGEYEVEIFNLYDCGIFDPDEDCKQFSMVELARKIS